jgi:hypothetical protein
MTHNQTITNLIDLINKICELKEAGVEIEHKECPTDLSWVWINKDTDRVIDTIKISRIKSLIFSRKTDPRIKYLVGFVAGADPIVARDAINKLEKLKAFW